MHSRFYLKFIHSEKARKFCEIFPLLLTVCTIVKSKGKISQNFQAFSDYMNFTNFIIFSCHLLNKIIIFHKYLVERQSVIKENKNNPSEKFSPYHCEGGHGGYAISSSMQMMNRSYDKGGILKWKSLLEHQIRKSRLLQRLLTTNFWGKEAWRPTQKWSFFEFSRRTHTISLKEMGKILQN